MTTLKKRLINNKNSKLKIHTNLNYDYQKILHYDITDMERFKIAYYLVNTLNLKYIIKPNLLHKLKSIKINNNIQYQTIESKSNIEEMEYLRVATNDELYQHTIETLTHKIIFTHESTNKIINVYYDGTLPKNMETKLGVILEMFDIIMKGRKKYYNVDIFLSKFNRQIDDNEINRHNLNGGTSNLKRYFAVVYREEEWEKVLIHELVHYTHLHTSDIREQLRFVFNDIKIYGSTPNPDEAYVEYFALLLSCVYFHYMNNININLERYINMRMTLEMGWSMGQVIKIFHNKGLETYQDLFEKEFRQNTAILSYFLLKLYYMCHHQYQDCIRFNSYHDINQYANMNIKTTRFSQLMDSGFKELNTILKSKSLRMTCLN